MSRSPARPERTGRTRMTSAERREQLIDVGRGLFADKGFEGTSVEEIAATAEVSKPVVYEHFGGKEGLYAVVVDREVRTMLDGIRGSLSVAGGRTRRSDRADRTEDRDEPLGRNRELVERAALAMLDYIDSHTDGFRILVRDSSVGSAAGSMASILSGVADRVTDILVEEFRARGLDHKTAPMYAQMLTGMVALTGQWWLDVRKPRKSEVAAHLVNLAWNGLSGLEKSPKLISR